MTLRSEGLCRIYPDTYVEMNRRTALDQGGLVTGDWVKLSTPRRDVRADPAHRRHRRSRAWCRCRPARSTG